MNWICFRVLHKRTCLEIYSQPWKKYYYGHFHVNRKVLMMAYLKPMGPVIVGNFLTHVWSICTYLFHLFASISCIYFWIRSTANMVAGNFCSIFCRLTIGWLCFCETTSFEYWTMRTLFYLVDESACIFDCGKWKF